MKLAPIKRSRLFSQTTNLRFRQKRAFRKDAAPRLTFSPRCRLPPVPTPTNRLRRRSRAPSASPTSPALSPRSVAPSTRQSPLIRSMPPGISSSSRIAQALQLGRLLKMRMLQTQKLSIICHPSNPSQIPSRRSVNFGAQCR